MMAAADRHSKSNGQGQGMNFVRPEKRIALYLRDGLACGFVNQSIYTNFCASREKYTRFHSHLCLARC